jgi:glycerophosphoryl diester phosphodiesterase
MNTQGNSSVTKKKIMNYFLVILAIFIIIPFINLLLVSTKNLRHSGILIVGHRGAGNLAPENTLAAIDSGLSYHADFIEIDVRETLDGQLIVLHDKTVDRTTNGTGKANTLSYDKISQLNASVKFNSYKAVTRIPLLRDVLLRINRSNAKLLIEIKDPELYPGMVPKLTALIRETNSINKVLIFSFNPTVIEEVKKALPGVETGIFCIGFEYKRNTVNYICPNWISILYFPFIVEMIHKHGSKVLVWTPNNAFAMKYLIRKNVDGIITDCPDILATLISNSNKN